MHAAAYLVHADFTEALFTKSHSAVSVVALYLLTSFPTIYIRFTMVVQDYVAVSKFPYTHDAQIVAFAQSSHVIFVEPHEMFGVRIAFASVLASRCFWPEIFLC